MKFTRRPRSEGTNTLSLTGAKIGRLTVGQLVGYARHMSVWECTCDCGNPEPVTYHGAFLNHARNKLHRGEPLGTYRRYTHCGCLNKAAPFGGDTDARRVYHKLKKASKLPPRWLADPTLFMQECWAKRPPPMPGKAKNRQWCLHRWNDSLPLDHPGNLFWSMTSERAKNTFRATVQAIMQLEGCNKAHATRRAMSVTRERRRQLLNRGRGLCSVCGDPVEPGRKSCRSHLSSKKLYFRKARARKMGRPVNEFPTRGPYRSYPWDQWLDGQVWELEQGVDFENVASLRSTLSHQKQQRGLKVKTRLLGTKLYLQAIKP